MKTSLVLRGTLLKREETKNFLKFPNTNKYLFCYSGIEGFNKDLFLGVDLLACYWGASQQIIKDKGGIFTKKGARSRAPFLVDIILAIQPSPFRVLVG